MRIIIATGIYPPEVGGPAHYAKALAKELMSLGHTVSVVTYGRIKMLPSGLRHLLFFFKLLPRMFGVTAVIALDTFSAGFPAVCAGIITRTPIIIRTGGDFLWEFYVERTGEKILLSDFYKERRALSFKERTIFTVTCFTLQHTARLVFSTTYQRDIFVPAYNLNASRTAIVENFYTKPEEGQIPPRKNYVCFVRNLKWKNLDMLKRAFAEAREETSDITLEIEHDLSRTEVLERLKSCYAAILVSLGDISPNFVLEALAYQKPVILTTETGIRGHLKDVALFANPLDMGDITEKILWLADAAHYGVQKDKVKQLTFVHSYEDIAREFTTLIESL